MLEAAALGFSTLVLFVPLFPEVVVVVLDDPEEVFVVEPVGTPVAGVVVVVVVFPT